MSHPKIFSGPIWPTPYKKNSRNTSSALTLLLLFINHLSLKVSFFHPQSANISHFPSSPSPSFLLTPPCLPPSRAPAVIRSHFQLQLWSCLILSHQIFAHTFPNLCCSSLLPSPFFFHWLSNWSQKKSAPFSPLTHPTVFPPLHLWWDQCKLWYGDTWVTTAADGICFTFPQLVFVFMSSH